MPECNQRAKRTPYIERLQFMIVMDEPKMASEDVVILKTSDLDCALAAWKAAKVKPGLGDRYKLTLRQNARVMRKHPGDETD